MDASERALQARNLLTIHLGYSRASASEAIDRLGVPLIDLVHLGCERWGDEPETLGPRLAQAVAELEAQLAVAKAEAGRQRLAAESSEEPPGGEQTADGEGDDAGEGAS